MILNAPPKELAFAVRQARSFIAQILPETERQHIPSRSVSSLISYLRMFEIHHSSLVQEFKSRLQAVAIALDLIVGHRRACH